MTKRQWAIEAGFWLSALILMTGVMILKASLTE